MPRFLADENVFTATTQLMRDLGLQVERVQELGMIGSDDPAVYRKAQELNAVLLTNDHGFGDVRLYPPSSHKGVIVLKIEPDPNKVGYVHAILKDLLVRERYFENCLFIVDARKYRKRKRPQVFLVTAYLRA